MTTDQCQYHIVALAEEIERHDPSTAANLSIVLGAMSEGQQQTLHDSLIPFLHSRL